MVQVDHVISIQRSIEHSNRKFYNILRYKFFFFNMKSKHHPSISFHLAMKQSN